MTILRIIWATALILLIILIFMIKKWRKTKEDIEKSKTINNAKDYDSWMFEMKIQENEKQFKDMQEVQETI